MRLPAETIQFEQVHGCSQKHAQSQTGHHELTAGLLGVPVPHRLERDHEKYQYCQAIALPLAEQQSQHVCKVLQELVLQRTTYVNM